MSSIATIAIVGSVVAGEAQKSSAKKATQAQLKYGEEEIEEKRRQFDKMQEVLAPYMQSGEGATAGIGDLLGLSGREKASEAIYDIEASPEFQARTRLGEEAILQNASATGGLRGGNTQAALAEFRPQVLSDMINQRFQRLGGVAQLGQASAAGVGAGAMQLGESVGGTLRNQGEALGQGYLARGNINAGMVSDFSRMAGNFAGGGF